MAGFGQDMAKLNVWAPVPTSLQWPRVYAAFEKKYPNIQIEYWRGETSDYVLKLQVAMAGGEGPDSLWLNGSMISRYASFLDSLNDTASKAWGADWEKDLASAKYINDISDNGKVVSMPFLVAGQPFVLYDKTVFDRVRAEAAEDVRRVEESQRNTESPRNHSRCYRAQGWMDQHRHVPGNGQPVRPRQGL